VSKLVFWLAVGFLGQALFTARFLVQWVASERKHDSVVPVAFWWLSLLGGTALLCYALFRGDPVIVTGQAMGLFVYVRNLMLVRGARQRAARYGVRSLRAVASANPSYTLELNPTVVTPPMQSHSADTNRVRRPVSVPPLHEPVRCSLRDRLTTRAKSTSSTWST